MGRNKICGVYKITNKITGEFYIGSSVDIKSRYSLHMGRDARKYSKKGHKFYVDIINYGKENFTLEILEECERDNKIEREQYWYDLLKPTYNKVRPTECNFIYESVRKNSIKNSNDEEHVRARKELYNNDYYKNLFRYIHTNKMKKVDMILNGEIIKTFLSFQEAARYITETTDYKGKSKAIKIKEVCDGHRPSAYGYVWKYSKV